MVKKQSQYTESAAIVIDNPILEILKITNKSTFNISADDKNLIFSLHIENNQKKTILRSLERK